MEQLTMSRKARERMVIFSKIKSKEMSRREASEVLGLSLRQVHRMFLRFLNALRHGLFIHLLVKYSRTRLHKDVP